MAITRPSDRNDLSIHANNFGGLNTTASPLNIPIEDSPFLLNVDVDVSGKVKKRLGTRLIWKEQTDKRLPVFEFNSNLGYSFLLSKLDTAIRVFEVDNDVTTLKWQKTGVFRPSTEYIQSVTLPGEEPRILFLNKTSTPIQLRLVERRYYVEAGSTVNPTFKNSEKFENSYADALIYLNGVPYLTGSPSYSGVSGLTINGSFNVGDTLDVLSFTWQWWAEALFWYGDNFHRTVPRPATDRIVAVPDTIYSDVAKENTNYGILAYATNRFGNAYQRTTQPVDAYQYGYSDGGNYTYSVSNSLTPSPFFVTFGQVANEVKITFSDDNILDSVFYIQGHQLQDYDIVSFSTARPGIAANTGYFVNKINDNSFTISSSSFLTPSVTIGAAPTVTFTDGNVSVAANLINVTHPFSVGQATQVRFANAGYKLPEGLNVVDPFWVYAPNSTSLEVYYDQSLLRRVDILPRPYRQFSSSNVTPSTDTVTINNHLLFTGDTVRVVPSPGATMPGGLPASTQLWVVAIDANNVSFYSDSALTTLVDITSAGSGNFELRDDGGTHRVTQFYGSEQVLTKERLENVEFVRRRDLKFNNGAGLTADNLYVSVNGVESIWNNDSFSSVVTPYSYHTFQTVSSTPQTTIFDTVRFISFTGSNFVGVPRDSVIRLVNTETKWCGANANTLPDSYSNGNWVPAYGLGMFADYANGYFPGVGGIFQNRLVLSGFVNSSLQVIFSSISDGLTPNEFFQYFQVTDDLRNPLIDPFDLLLPGDPNNIVKSVIEWQKSLYIFTAQSVYRTFSDDVSVNTLNKSTGLVSNQGIVNERCVCVTESTLIYLSDTGMYDIKPILEGEYRSGEVSLKIRDKFGLTAVQKYRDLAWVAYDKTFLRVYVGVPRQEDTTNSSALFIYDTQQQSWTEYSSFWRFRTYYGLQYTDKTLGKQFMVSNALPCFSAFTRFNYTKYADFTEKDTTLINSVPAFWITETYVGIDEYTVDIPMLFISNVQDVRLFWGSSLSSMAEMTWQTAWEKTNDGRVRLKFNPGLSGYIAIVPKLEGSHYGANLWIDNILQDLADNSFGVVDFSNACVCTFPVGYSENDSRPCEYNLVPNAIGEIGYPYLSVYVSPTLTQELLSSFKRVKHLNAMFSNSQSRYTYSDVNTFTQQPSDIVNKKINDMNVSLAIIFQSDNEAENSVDVYDYSTMHEEDSHTLFREPLMGIGYSYQFVCWSNDIHTWVLNGYQITGKPSGERHTSASRKS